MTSPRNKGEKLSETCKTHLVDVFVSYKYKRKTDIHNKYVEKGLMVEEDSITLFSRATKTFFKKNEEHLSNEFIKGTPDLFQGSEIKKAEKIIDIKSSWDIFTFFRTAEKEINMNYYWQLQGYMALTGAPVATLAYCLVNTPDTIMSDEKRKLQWRMGIIDDTPDFIEACKEIDKLSIYDDIPINERIYTLDIERNDSDIERLYEKIKECRIYMNENLFKNGN